MWLPKACRESNILFAWNYSWNSFPVFIKVCFVISMLALLGIIIAMGNIYAWRISKRRSEKKVALLSASINQLLMSTVLPGPTVQIKQGLRIGDFDTRPFYALGVPAKDVKKILVSEMIGYRSYFSGVIADRVRKLYLDLSLHKEATVRLYKKNWETKVSALAELFKMDVQVDHPYLLELVTDKNRYIRDLARLSLIKFTEDDPLQFLRELNEPISQWEAFEIYVLFQQRPEYTLSSLEGLISLDKEPTVVSLCLKLAVYFRQLSSVELIIDLIKTPDLKLRAEAIASLGKLEAKKAEPHLVAIYRGQPQGIKLEILTALGRIQSGRYLDFLEDEFTSSPDFEIKKHASDAIIKLYPLSQKTIDKLMNSTVALDQRILNHSLNPLINPV